MIIATPLLGLRLPPPVCSHGLSDKIIPFAVKIKLDEVFICKKNAGKFLIKPSQF
jgi:hypothetical protein